MFAANNVMRSRAEKKQIFEILLAAQGSSWTPPSGVTEVNAYVQAAGGNAWNGGGGGGAFASKNAISVSGPTAFSIGTPGAGTKSWFKGTTVVIADCGVTPTTGTIGAAGGLASNSIGDVVYSGGTGGNAQSSSGGGGGGGSAGPNGDGKNGGNGTSADGGGGGGGSNGGVSTAGSNASTSAGANGGTGPTGTAGGAGGSPGAPGSNGSGGGGGSNGQYGNSGTPQPLFTDNSSGPNRGLTVGPCGGSGGCGNGGPQPLKAGYGAGGGGKGSSSTAGIGGDSYIVLEYWR